MCFRRFFWPYVSGLSRTPDSRCFSYRNVWQNQPRMEHTGIHFLRKTSLDELPQLFNVLKGDMNLVGPRPALYNQEDLMAERDKYGANFIRPGITGLAQVMGRDELPIDVKARYDGIYTQYVGPVVDLFSLIRTIAVVVTSDGVVEGGTGAMEDNEGE